MYILSDKILTTRKRHKCSACGRVFDAGTKMRTQVNTSDGLQTWRECPTCQILLSEHRSRFDDGCGACWMNCVDESLDVGQTPEELLVVLESSVSSACAKCGAKTKHLKKGLCYGCTMIKG